MTAVDRAADAIARGDLVVYPTETVYGLAGDALDPDAVARVFAAKGRARDDPVSLAVPDVETALEYTAPTAPERRFMREYLPGPVTVVVDRDGAVPDALTAGRDRVGVRIPQHATALSFLEAAGPVTGTSANPSGAESPRRPAALDPAIRDAAAVVLADGALPGTESTVVDVSAGRIIRAGALADEVRLWLARE